MHQQRGSGAVREPQILPSAFLHYVTCDVKATSCLHLLGESHSALPVGARPFPRIPTATLDLLQGLLDLQESSSLKGVPQAERDL